MIGHVEYPGAAGSGEVKACRGGVVEAAAGARLNNLAQTGLLIYSLELEEWQSGGFLASWPSESRAHGRAEESSGTREGVVKHSAIAGKSQEEDLLYKVNVRAMLVWPQ